MIRYLTAAVAVAAVLAVAPAGAAPIHEAAWAGDLARVSELLDQDAGQVGSWQDNQARNPLHIAVQRDNLELAKLLISRGADVNAAGVKSGDYSYAGIGVTPLHLAAGKGSLEMMRLLISAGADVNAPSVPTWVRLQSDSVLDSEALAELMNSVRVHGKTPLHFAAMKGKTAAAELLLESGAVIDPGDERGQTPAHLAAYYGRRDLLATLLAKGASLTARSKDGWGLVHFAAAGGNPDTINFLLEGGANVNEASCADAASCAKITPLHLAALRGSAAAISTLLARGADPSARSAGGSTPIDLALPAHSDLADLMRRGMAASAR